MSAADGGSAEEFYSRCLTNAIALDQAAQGHVARGEAVAAVATAWGADVFLAQAVLWERINIASRAPSRRYFVAAGQLTDHLAGLPPISAGASTAREVVERARAGILGGCEPSLASRLQDEWAPIDYLDDVPAPSDADLRAFVVTRLEGSSPAQFIALRRERAQVAMDEAQTLRIRRDLSAAVEKAYFSDLAALDAYLVSSAVSAGDEQLFTVAIRWELARRALAEMPGLPEGFVGAVEAIRQAMRDGLGPADGDRLAEFFVRA